LYFSLLAFGYFFFAEIFLLPFGWYAETSQFGPVKDIAKTLLKFVAIYSIFDAFNMIFSAALKGAGDTRFVATLSIILSWILMLIPSYITIFIFDAGVNWLWAFVTLYILGLGVVFLWRFLKGPWRTMRVIEESEL
jgi:MATE family multidrug resistance protein